MGYGDDLRAMEAGRNFSKGLAAVVCGAGLTAGAAFGIETILGSFADHARVPRLLVNATAVATTLGPALLYDGIWLVWKRVDVPIRRQPETHDERRLQKPYLGGLLAIAIASMIMAVLVALD
jgi:hypothetical protein